MLLTAASLVAVPGELRGDLPDVDLVGELEQAPPVGHLGAPLLLVGRGPVEDGVEGAHLHARLLLRLVEFGDEGVVGSGTVVPEVEVRVGRELDVLEAQLGGLVERAHRGHGAVVHVRVKGDVYQGGLLSGADGHVDNTHNVMTIASGEVVEGGSFQSLRRRPGVPLPAAE